MGRVLLEDHVWSRWGLILQRYKRNKCGGKYGERERKILLVEHKVFVKTTMNFGFP